MPLLVARPESMVAAEPAEAVKPSAQTVAASAEKQEATPLWVVGAYLLVVAGAFAGWGLFKGISPKALVPGAGISLFAPMYILAQSIERFLEPFTSMLGMTKDSEGATDKPQQRVTKKDAQKARDAALATALSPLTGDPTAELQTASNAQALIDRIRLNRAVIAWGIASFVAMMLCGAFGVRLLRAAGFDVPAFWDIAITGLAVGSGTKPLHDLISNIQKAKTEKEDPTNVTTTD